MALGFAWHHINFIGYTGKYSAIIARSSYRLCRLISATVSRSWTFQLKIFVDLGGNCCGFADFGLFNSDLRHQKVWRHKIRGLGMYNWIPACILDGALGCDHRSFYRCFCWWTDWRERFQNLISSRPGFFCRVSARFFSQTCYLLYDAILCDYKYLGHLPDAST